jgi:SpoVK/Ycf46/Vps4 family AAA+-type ATPase
LRAALAVSPDNVPLRRHVAETLLGLGRAADAVDEFRAALRIAPEEPESKLGLARAYQQDGRKSEALVVLENLVASDRAPAKAYVLYARLLFNDGDVPNAVAQYKLGIEKDAAAGDAQLAAQLGVGEYEDSYEVSEGRLRHAADDAGDMTADIERPKFKFSDVGGMSELKEEIGMKIIYPLAHVEMFKAYGKAIGGGILMYGPPGCGKTHLARATAGEIKAAFMSIGINDVVEMWIGNSERNLHGLFEQARANKPCVMFFDEVDALGSRRTDMRQSAGRHLINQFLSEMDGLEKVNDGLLILAATNAPWHVDPAFRRPGRFDRVLFVPPPDQPARAAILRIHLAGKPVRDIDYDAVAKKTDGFSGADLKAVVDQAVEHKLREAMKSGKPTPLITADLSTAAKYLKPTTKEWFATARNYALYSNQDGLYDDILKHLKM